MQFWSRESGAILEQKQRLGGAARGEAGNPVTRLSGRNGY